MGRLVCAKCFACASWKVLSQRSFQNGLKLNFSVVQRAYSSDAETEAPVLVDSLGSITTIGLNRPDKRNSVNAETAQQLSKAILDFENDESSLVGVLYGKGGNFCAGYDLEEVGSSNMERLCSLPHGEGPMGPTRRFVKKPLIAAVNGYAVAGGMELALMCDLRVMEDTAIMGVFCRRFGVPLIDGGTVRLQAAVGLSRALDLILTGRPIKAKEAFEWGLVNRIVACGTALGQAVNLAQSLIKFPQECLNADRASAYYSAFSAANLEDALMYESKSMSDTMAQSAIEGAHKFMSGIGKHGKFALFVPEDQKKEDSS